jgi:hypothetical protein
MGGWTEGSEGVLLWICSVWQWGHIVIVVFSSGLDVLAIRSLRYPAGFESFSSACTFKFINECYKYTLHYAFAGSKQTS